MKNLIKRDLLFRAEPEGDKQLKFDHTAQARLCHAKLLGGSDVKTNVFEFCLGRFSALSGSFILAVNTSDLVVELWLKDTN